MTSTELNAAVQANRNVQWFSGTKSMETYTYRTSAGMNLIRRTTKTQGGTSIHYSVNARGHVVGPVEVRDGDVDKSFTDIWSFQDWVGTVTK